MSNFDETLVVCADCGDVVSIHNAEGRWCSDCFDLGLKKDMHDFSINNIRNEMEEGAKSDDFGEKTERGFNGQR